MICYRTDLERANLAQQLNQAAAARGLVVPTPAALDVLNHGKTCREALQWKAQIHNQSHFGNQPITETYVFIMARPTVVPGVGLVAPRVVWDPVLLFLRPGRTQSRRNQLYCFEPLHPVGWNWSMTATSAVLRYYQHFVLQELGRPYFGLVHHHTRVTWSDQVAPGGVGNAGQNLANHLVPVNLVAQPPVPAGGDAMSLCQVMLEMFIGNGVAGGTNQDDGNIAGPWTIGRVFNNFILR
jgi:hypothetical protein